LRRKGHDWIHHCFLIFGQLETNGGFRRKMIRSHSLKDCRGERGVGRGLGEELAEGKGGGGGQRRGVPIKSLLEVGK